MLDERELLNRIERVPAAPDRIVEIQDCTVKTGGEADFEKQWHDFAAEQTRLHGCKFVRLHRDTENPSHYLIYAVWDSRRALVDALRAIPEEPAYPVMGEPHLTYVREAAHLRGSNENVHVAKPGNIASLRGFYLKVGSEPRFEQLWTKSALSEVAQRGCLHKRLHRDLNLPTHYVSYSLWTDIVAQEEAASKHAHWQSRHEPYPLASPVVRLILEVRDNALGSH